MATQHGVDVSWLHHSKDPHAIRDSGISFKEKDKDKTKPKDKDVTPPLGAWVPEVSDGDPNRDSDAIKPGDTVNGTHVHVHKSLLHHKQNEEAISSPPATPPPTTAATKESKPRPGDGKRRGSWISNISSKFSSSSPQAPVSSPAPATVSTADVKEVTAGVGSGAANTSTPKEVKKVENSPAAVSSPKSGGPSFLQSALRRLSSSGGGGSGGSKVQGNGGICPRKVMNVDPYRERCQIDDLHPARMRRVSFCVDVEIAAPVHYDDPEEEAPPTPTPPGRRPSLSQLEKMAAAKKAREHNVKIKEMAEAEALKNPEAVAQAKENTGDVEATEAEIEPTPNPAATQEANGEQAGCEGKKKKKRTEAEKAERRERKRQAALANGSIPMELSLNHSSSEENSAPGTPILSSQDRPTTNPLRIYRRCCQLRESPVLKRIADQLSAENAIEPDTSGVVTCIDLTGFKIPLSDTITLGDWLAIVPVRKLVLEDCDLTDEALRVVLAGLLAVKTPDQARHNRHLARGSTENGVKMEQLGVIEKISLKDNPRVTREGWRHISYFINMSRSLKAIDISGIKLPSSEEIHKAHHHFGKAQESKAPFNVAEVFEKCLAERVAKDRLEELVMAKCELDTSMVESIIRGVTACGIRRLGLAYNNLDTAGIEAMCNFILAGSCDGLDLGGNDLADHIPKLVTALGDPSQPLFALSVADCKLSPQSLKMLLPVLTKLKNFKFIDLSHNHQLFETQPNAIPLLRKYLPQMEHLRRMHLNDVAMDSEQCIAIAEVLPEIPNLAHLGILENPKLTALASARDEALQGEACAFYASIMVAVRVSRSIVSIDMDMPTQDASELVKALGKQILAYSLRNLEHGPAAEALGTTASGRKDSLVEVPDILLHLVGHVDGFPENHDNDAPAPSEDYIASGTGVVKALGICLGNKASDRRSSRAFSRDRSGVSSGNANTPAKDSGTSTPLLAGQEVDQFKAKDMSKNLLDSARKIRHRLQPALARESKGDDEMTFRRLKFLDVTLERMIERFEEEYPEVRPPKPATSDAVADDGSSQSSQLFRDPFGSAQNSSGAQEIEDQALDDDEDDIAPALSARRLSRHGSDASLAARHQAHEEGQMHRFGQQIRRSLLAPPSFDYHHQTTSDDEAEHLRLLRCKLETLSGDEIKDQVAAQGIDNLVHEMGLSAQSLATFAETDPEGFAKLREAQLHAVLTDAAAEAAPDSIGTQDTTNSEKSNDKGGLEMKLAKSDK